MNRYAILACLSAIALGLSACSTGPRAMKTSLHQYTLDYSTPTDPAWQSELVRIDATLRAKYGMSEGQTAVGVLDLRSLRLAMLHPDREEYAASVPKIGILLAYFVLHPQAATNLPPETRQQLGLMAKASSNEEAARFSQEMGLQQVQTVINSQGFYDAAHGGGIWVGKHYGKSGERYGSPVGDNSHGATIRQLLRYFLLLEQEKLVSAEASRTMRQIFASPAIPHDQIKFVKGLANRDVQIIRKWGSWEDWLHDVAVVTGPNRHYIIAALTRHPKGDEYLEELARAVDDLVTRQ